MNPLPGAEMDRREALGVMAVAATVQPQALALPTGTTSIAASLPVLPVASRAMAAAYCKLGNVDARTSTEITASLQRLGEVREICSHLVAGSNACDGFITAHLPLAEGFLTPLRHRQPNIDCIAAIWEKTIPHITRAALDIKHFVEQPGAPEFIQAYRACKVDKIHHSGQGGGLEIAFIRAIMPDKADEIEQKRKHPDFSAREWARRETGKCLYAMDELVRGTRIFNHVPFTLSEHRHLLTSPRMLLAVQREGFINILLKVNPALHVQRDILEYRMKGLENRELERIGRGQKDKLQPLDFYKLRMELLLALGMIERPLMEESWEGRIQKPTACVRIS